ncbi:Poly(A) polymerase Gamma [Manis pentadactyla]|nr:Poly(A) polymerase Gamma [Manis pentadactyla]
MSSMAEFQEGVEIVCRKFSEIQKYIKYNEEKQEQKKNEEEDRRKKREADSSGAREMKFLETETRHASHFPSLELWAAVSPGCTVDDDSIFILRILFNVL